MADDAATTAKSDADLLASKASSVSYTPQLASASIKITRNQLLEYMNQRDWWAVAQLNLLVTLAMWAVFITQMYMRADVENSFDVSDAVMQHIHHITAHPALSGIPFLSQEEVPVPCLCACRSSSKGFPDTACGDTNGEEHSNAYSSTDVGITNDGTEFLNFVGLLPPKVKLGLLEKACSDMPAPLAEFAAALSPGFASHTCTSWVHSYGSYEDPLLGKTTACSPEQFEAYLYDHIMNPDNVNDTDSRFLYDQGDFNTVQWRCPATCGVCETNPGLGFTPMVWDDLESEEDVLLWLEHGLLPDIFTGAMQGPLLQKPGTLAQKNLFIGGLRARQVRAREPFECQAPDDVKRVYVPECRSPDPTWSFYGLKHNITDEMFDVYFEFDMAKNEAMELATQLRRSDWIDRATRELKIEGLLLNAEAGFYGVLDMSFTFRFDGVVDKRLGVHMFQVVVAVDLQDYIPELIWVGLIIILLLIELWQIARMTCQRKVCEYFKDAWNIVDWVSIACGLVITLTWYMVVMQTVALSEAISALPRSPFPAGFDNEAYRQKWTSLLDDGVTTFHFKQAYQFFMFCYSSIITTRFLKGFLGQQKLAMIQYAMWRSTIDVVHFQIIFLVVFGAFVTGGHILFGAELAAWSSVVRAASTTLQMLMGTFKFDELYEVAPVSASVWFWSFLLIMVFLLLNLLASILCYHFQKFRSMIGPTDSMFYDIHQGWRDFWWRCEWRIEQIRDGEYMEFFRNPYADLYEGLAENAQMPEEMDEMAQKNCLGIRMVRSKMDVLSMEGVAADAVKFKDPGIEFVTSRELRKIACDPMTAEHLMEECDEKVNRDKATFQRLKNSQVEQARHFMNMLRKNRDQLSAYCDAIEAGVEEEQASLMEGLDRLEDSIGAAMDGILELRQTEVDSLALAPPRLQYAGTTLRDTYTNQLGRRPPRKGTAPVPGRDGLRLTAQADSPLALGYGSAAGTAAVQPALAYGGSQPAALLDGSQHQQPVPPAVVDPNQLALPGPGDAADVS
mmetsp:Transcript_11261/g.30159  ORF Transcript_11261/g.30159 Transcript_11261/m.30159 type:complete len:1014 (-) Transcript_11261:251-3292(-)